MRLTATETRIIEHRLAIGDCIADAMTDMGDDDPPVGFTADEIVDAANDLHGMLPDLPDAPSSLQRAVLWDALDGSTYVQACEAEYESDNMSLGTWLSIQKAAGTLERKISRLIGREVETCRH